MNNNKIFRVAVIAELSQHEWQILATATRLTTGQARSYVFEPSSSERADIYLVDAEQEDALSLWQLHRIQNDAPVVFLTAEPKPSSERREFRAPVVPSCLLTLVKMLDEVTVLELHYLPELTIGQEGEGTSEPVAISGTNSRYSALVVDDSTTVQAQVGLGLKMYGIAADFADTAEDAVNLLADNYYDIAFLDVVLPGGTDGYQICKAIKRNPKSKDTIVVMLTGKSSTFDRVRASMAGCDAYLTKPVKNELFQETLRKYLDESNEIHGDKRLETTR